MIGPFLLITTAVAGYLLWRKNRGSILRWIVWSPTRTIAVGAGLSLVLGMGFAMSFPSLPKPPQRTAAAVAPAPTVTPAPTPSRPWFANQTPAATSRSSASPTPTPEPTHAEHDDVNDQAHAAAEAAGVAFASAFVNAGKVPEQQWRAQLLATSAPSLHVFLRAASYDNAPQATITAAEVDSITPYDATVDVALADGPDLRLGLVYDGQVWLVDEYQTAVA